MKKFLKNIFNKKFISAFLLAIFLFSNVLVYALPPKKADAQISGIIGSAITSIIGCAAAALIGGVLSFGFTPETQTGSGAGEVPTFNDDQDAKQKAINVKNELSDCLVWAVTQTIIDGITRSTLGYITTGYGGDAFFVRDRAGFFNTLEDQIANSFITTNLSNINLQNLPSSFGISVRNAVARDSTRPSATSVLTCDEVLTNPQINLSNILNAGPFVDYSVIQARYERFMSDKACTPYGAYLLATAQKQYNIDTGTISANKEIKDSQGYLSARDTNTGKITTPGVNIKSMVQKVINSNVDQLENADELSELLSSVLNGLVTSIFNVGAGLCGAGGISCP